MTSHDSRRDEFDLLMAGWMDADARVREPEDLIARVLEQTQRTSRVPGWLLPERWIPVQLTARWQPVPRLAPLLVLLGLLIGAALAVLVAGSRPRLPEAIGLAGNGRIAFVSGGDLVTAAANGSDVRPVAGGARAASPVYSPDGTRIAFRRIADGSTASDPTLFGDLVVADADGTDPVIIASGVESMSPAAWSPDSTQLLYSAALGGVERIFRAAVDGSAAPVAIGPDSSNWLPRWSPDGRSVAFFVTGGGLWLMGADGSGAHPLTRDVYQALESFEWKPDGSAIVFSATKRMFPGHDLFIVGFDGQLERMVTTDHAGHVAASWSPDGRHLVHLRALTAETAELIRTDGDGRDPRSLPGAFAWSSPKWSPDGTRIVAVTAGPTHKLVQIDPFGSAPEVVLDIEPPAPQSIAVTADEPSWQRVTP